MKRVLGLIVLVAVAAFAVTAFAEKAMEKAKPTILKGELVDMGCYIARGAMGEKHKECGTKCIAGGMPMGILAGSKLYLVTLNHDNPDAFNKLKDWAGQMVEVTGTVAVKDGIKSIDVTDAKPAATAATK